MVAQMAVQSAVYGQAENSTITENEDWNASSDEDAWIRQQNIPGKRYKRL